MVVQCSCRHQTTSISRLSLNQKTARLLSIGAGAYSGCSTISTTIKALEIPVGNDDYIDDTNPRRKGLLFCHNEQIHSSLDGSVFAFVIMASLAPPSPRSRTPSPAPMPKKMGRRIERYCCLALTYFPLLFVLFLTTWAVWVSAYIGFYESNDQWWGMFAVL